MTQMFKAMYADGSGGPVDFRYGTEDECLSWFLQFTDEDRELFFTDEYISVEDEDRFLVIENVNHWASMRPVENE